MSSVSTVRCESVAVRNVWSKLCTVYWNNGELNDLLGSAVRRMIGALDVDCECERGMQTEVWWCNVQERDHMQFLGVNGRIILKLILQKYDGSALTALMCLRVGTGCCGDGNEPSGSIKFREFFGWMRNA